MRTYSIDGSIELSVKWEPNFRHLRVRSRWRCPRSLNKLHRNETNNMKWQVTSTGTQFYYILNRESRHIEQPVMDFDQPISIQIFIYYDKWKACRVAEIRRSPTKQRWAPTPYREPSRDLHRIAQIDRTMVSWPFPLDSWHT